MMPPALKPWAEWVRPLLADVQEDVARLASCLDGLLGPVRPRHAVRRGAPDGYRGLARRGPYDRLVLSEWALLDEAPDEFIRRATSGEHAFYDLDKRDPGTGARVRVVLDAGPTQLGAPRIVQLAVLFVMARRAERAGATLVWSVAGSSRPPSGTVDEPGVLGLLAARTTAPFTRPDLHDEEPVDELWAIGPVPGPATEGMRVLTLTERLGPDDEHVDVTLHVPGRPPVTVPVPLPARARRAALLTNPFAQRPPRKSALPAAPGTPWRPHPFDLTTPRMVRFLSGTDQLVAMYERDVCALWSLANVAARGVPKARKHADPMPSSLVAIGYHRQLPFSVLLSTDKLQVTDGRVTEYPVPGPLPPGLGFAWCASSDGPHVRFVDANRDLWVAWRSPHRVEREAQHVVDLIRHDVYALIVAGRPGDLRLYHATQRGGLNPGTELPDAQDARFAGNPDLGGSLWVLVGDLWTRRTPWGQPMTPLIERAALPGSRVLGILPPPATPGLVQWRPGSSNFYLGTTLLQVPRTPLDPQVSGRHLAFHTAQGTVEVWDLLRQEPSLLRRTEPRA